MKFNHIELVEIEEGREVVIETAELLPGVTLKVYNQEDAELIVEGGELPFKWTDKTRSMVGRLAVDLLGLIKAA